MIKAQVMAEALGRPPSLNAKEVVMVVCKYFNFKNVIEDSIKPLPSFEDQNVYFRGETLNGTISEFVLKLTNPLCTPTEVIKGLNAMMNHIRACRFQFSTCYPLPCKDGTDVMHLTADELTNVNYSGGWSNQVLDEIKSDSSLTMSSTSSCKQPELRYHVRVLVFIPGQVFDSVDKQHLTPALLQEVGEMIGKLNREVKVS